MYDVNTWEVNLKQHYYREFLEYFKTNYKHSSTTAITEIAMLIESKSYRWISKVMARFSGDILDSSKLNDTEYYLAKGKHIDYIWWILVMVLVTLANCTT